MSLDAGDARVRQLRLHAARARPRAGRGQADRDATWASARSSTATRRRRSAASRTASRRWRWPTRTRRSPPAACATARPRSRKVTFPDGRRRAAAALEGQAHAGVRGRRDRQGDGDPRAEHPGRHRHQGHDRLPGGRQDRHDRRRSPTPGSSASRRTCRPRCGSATPTPQVEMQTEYHGGSVAGGTFPAEIWGDYMKAVKGKFCGDFPPPKTPFQSSPFFGKYARGGGRGTGGSYRPELDAGAFAPTAPADAGARDRRASRSRTAATATTTRAATTAPAATTTAASTPTSTSRRPRAAARRRRPGRRGARRPTVDRGRTPGINPRSARPSGGLSMREGSARSTTSRIRESE